MELGQNPGACSAKARGPRKAQPRAPKSGALSQNVVLDLQRNGGGGEEEKRRKKERNRNKKPMLFADRSTMEEMPRASIHAPSGEAENELG